MNYSRCAANAKISSVYDRMPIIVRPEHESVWLDPEIKDIEQLAAVLQQLPDDGLNMYEVSPRVNSAAQDLPEMVEPAPSQSSIFDLTDRA